MAAKLEVSCDFDLHLELCDSPSADGECLRRQCVSADLLGLVEEACTTAVLTERLPADAVPVQAVVEPVWASRPLLAALDVIVTATGVGPSPITFSQRFDGERWRRTAAEIYAEVLQEQQREATSVYRVLVATTRATPLVQEIPMFESPLIEVQRLEEFGVQSLADGQFAAERPVLVNQRMVADILDHTEEAATNETGGVVLGKLVRLDEPLPGTSTRIVTILAAQLTDSRHVGDPASLRFSPVALAEAIEVARLRKRDERVLTVWHSHGWSSGCGNCGLSCALPNARLVSNDDYRLLDRLLSSKATLFPIAGRSGASPQPARPSLYVHGWQGGVMRPVPYRLYRD